MTRAYISGVGAYAPKRILTNADLERIVDTSDQWIVQRSGIRERHIAEEGEATSDLAVPAAQQALEGANLVPEDVEFIVVATTTPDHFFPSTANFVQHKLGAALALPAFRRFRRRVDYTEMGGAPLLGIDGAAIICHGSSPVKAIKNAVRVAQEWSKAGLNEHIKAALEAELARSGREGGRE